MGKVTKKTLNKKLKLYKKVIQNLLLESLDNAEEVLSFEEYKEYSDNIMTIIFSLNELNKNTNEKQK